MFKFFSQKNLFFSISQRFSCDAKQWNESFRNRIVEKTEIKKLVRWHDSEVACWFTDSWRWHCEFWIFKFEFINKTEFFPQKVSKVCAVVSACSGEGFVSAEQNSSNDCGKSNWLWVAAGPGNAPWSSPSLPVGAIHQPHRWFRRFSRWILHSER